MRQTYLNGNVLLVVTLCIFAGALLAAFNIITGSDWLGLIYMVLGYYLGNFRAVGRKHGEDIPSAGPRGG